MAELADAPDLGSGGHSRGGSNPFIRTIFLRGGRQTAADRLTVGRNGTLSFLFLIRVSVKLSFPAKHFGNPALNFSEKPVSHTGLIIPSTLNLCYTVLNYISMFTHHRQPS